MNLLPMALSLLALAAEGESKPGDDRLELGQVGGDCVLAYRIYDFVYAKGESRNLDRRGETLLNDGCTGLHEATIEPNGTQVRMAIVGEIPGGKLQGARLSYVGEDYRMTLLIGDVIESFYDAESECRENWYRVEMSVARGRKIRHVVGTLAGGCP